MFSPALASFRDLAKATLSRSNSPKPRRWRSLPIRRPKGCVCSFTFLCRALYRPGARFNDPHDATVRVLTQGLLDLGIIDRNKAGNVDEAIASRAYFPFYMHRTSHWLGMDVHDCGSYVEPGERGQTSERRDPLSDETIQDRTARILRPGMMLIIEHASMCAPLEAGQSDSGTSVSMSRPRR